MWARYSQGAPCWGSYGRAVGAGTLRGQGFLGALPKGHPGGAAGAGLGMGQQYSNVYYVRVTQVGELGQGQAWGEVVLEYIAPGGLGGMAGPGADVGRGSCLGGMAGADVG